MTNNATETFITNNATETFITHNATGTIVPARVSIALRHNLTATVTKSCTDTAASNRTGACTERVPIAA